MSSPGDDEATLGLPHAAAASSEALLGRAFGDCQLETCLIRGPGAWLYKGRDPRGRRALVQVSLLRSPEAGEEEAREATLREVAETTSLYARDPEMRVEDHGFDPEAGPGGALWWRLPWTGAAERIGHTKLSEPEDMTAAATSLLERLAARHARGRMEPLLDAAFIVPRTGGADLVGFPLRVPSGWLAPELRAAHAAPEERSVGELRRSGDLWRLGHALRALAVHAPAPIGFEPFLDRLTDPDPARRLASASEALVELEALQGTVAGAHADLLPERESLQPSRAAPATQLDPPSEAHEGAEERTLADVPVGALDGPPIDPAVKPRAAGADEAPTMWMMRDEVSATSRAQSAGDVQPTGPKGTVVGVRLPDAESQDPLGVDLEARPHARGRAPPTRVFDDPALRPAAEDPASPAQAGTAAVALGPGGTVAGSSSPALGFGPGGTVAAEVPPVGAPLPGTPSPPQATPPQAPAPPRSDRGRLVLTLLALLLLAVLAAVVVKGLQPSPETTAAGGAGREVGGPGMGARTVTPWNDVLLETVPADARIVGERDGASLGPSPVRLLVPAETSVAVLVTAPGYEPVRLILPTRGRVTVHLTSTGDVLDCPVDIQAPGSEPLEVVGLDIEPSETRRYSIPGAVVMRSVEGHGAWLVRCATYGGQRRHVFVSRKPGRDAQVEVTAPEGARLRIGGVGVGTVPGERDVEAGFVRLEAETDAGGTIARWVPAFSDTRVQLPRPAAKRASQ